MTRTIIRRENFKGRFFTVARMDGRFVAIRRWSPTTFNLSQAQRLFKKNNSFDPLVVRQTLTNVIEVTNFSPTGKPRGVGQYQVIARAKFKDGRQVVARSSIRSIETPRQVLAEEALENLRFRIAEDFNLSYDEDEGVRIIEDQKPNIEFGTVTYVANPRANKTARV